jgi:sialic acid synthase SpsE
MSVFVIAEIASAWVFGRDWQQNHDNALQAIQQAKAAGADAIKFQFVSDAEEMAVRRKVADADAYWRLCWPAVWLEEFAQHAAQQQLEFMVTAFLPEDIAGIAPHVTRFKVASLEAGDRALMKAILKHDKPVIVSTGCTTETELHDLPWWSEYARLLACTASYPCPLEEVNLKLVQRLDGLSDHTGDVLTGAVAVGAGAELLEVHFRLRDTPKDNPDYPHSHSPVRLKWYIRNVRHAQRMLGDGVKRIEKGEAALVQHKVLS